ncbi:MAG: hypothetical protein ACOYL6_07470 [Bacteriovoracaceae bacterium]
MFKLPILPKIVLDILGNIPTIAFKTVNLSELLSKSKNVLSQMKEKTPREEWLQSVSPNLPSQIKIELILKKPLAPVPGEDILRLYFSQFKNQEEVFLDMRSNHFNYQDGQTVWSPSSLVYLFEPEFKATLIRLYKGFYYEDELLFWQSLADLGLTQNLSHDQATTLMKLFQENFGTNFRNYHFDLKHFQESFSKIFEFFMEYEVKLKTDFLYLGVYLTTLFMHLDQYPGTYNVEAIFLEIFPRD